MAVFEKQLKTFNKMSVKNPYEKTVLMFLKLIGLLVVSPIIFSIALKAKRIYNQGIGIYVSSVLLIIGALLLIFTVYHGFKTIQTFLNALFRDKID